MRFGGLAIDTVVCLTLAKWETVSGEFGGYLIAPVPENPEMILIRPDPTDLVVPAGRYASVLKGVAYDFTLDGPTTR